MRSGQIEELEQKTASNGKGYTRVKINGQWHSAWEDCHEVLKGAYQGQSCAYEARQDGKFWNITTIRLQGQEQQSQPAPQAQSPAPPAGDSTFSVTNTGQPLPQHVCAFISNQVAHLVDKAPHMPTAQDIIRWTDEVFRASYPLRTGKRHPAAEAMQANRKPREEPPQSENPAPSGRPFDEAPLADGFDDDIPF